MSDNLNKLLDIKDYILYGAISYEQALDDINDLINEERKKYENIHNDITIDLSKIVSNTLCSEFKVLENYRKLFADIERSDHSLEYDGTELLHYRDMIERENEC